MTSPPWPCVCSCPVFVRACVTDSAVSLAEARYVTHNHRFVAKWLKLGIGAIGAAIDARKMRTAARGGQREGEIDTQREGEGERHTERRRRRKRDTDRETDVTDLLAKKGELRKKCDRGHRGQE